MVKIRGTWTCNYKWKDLSIYGQLWWLRKSLKVSKDIQKLGVLWVTWAAGASVDLQKAGEPKNDFTKITAKTTLSNAAGSSKTPAEKFSSVKTINHLANFWTISVPLIESHSPK